MVSGRRLLRLLQVAEVSLGAAARGERVGGGGAGVGGRGGGDRGVQVIVRLGIETDGRFDARPSIVRIPREGGRPIIGLLPRGRRRAGSDGGGARARVRGGELVSTWSPSERTRRRVEVGMVAEMGEGGVV